MVRYIKDQNCQVLVYIPIDPKSGKKYWNFQNLFFKLCGIKRIIGHPLAQRPNPRRLDSGLYESRAQRTAAAVKELADIDLDNPNAFDLMLTNPERLEAQKLLAPLQGRPLIAISLGTKRKVKDWENKNWIPFLQELSHRYPEHGLIAIGSESEFSRCQEVCQPWQGRFVNSCGKLTVRQSAAALEMCDIFVGHDSGPMHLAAAVGTRCVALFSSRNLPGEWFPCGKGHQILYHEMKYQGRKGKKYEKLHKASLCSITVEEVLTAVDCSMEESLQSA